MDFVEIELFLKRDNVFFYWVDVLIFFGNILKLMGICNSYFKCFFELG